VSLSQAWFAVCAWALEIHSAGIGFETPKSEQNSWLVGGLEHEWIMTFHILGILYNPN